MSSTKNPTLTNAPAAARYAVACLRYYLGQRGNPPGGFSHGLDLDAAVKIDLAVRDSLVAAGVSVQPTWQPANEYQERRWRKAYTQRGAGAAAGGTSPARPPPRATRP